MSVQTVIRDVETPPGEPFGVRRLPLQDSLPLLEPVKLLFGHPRPEIFRVGGGLRTQALILRRAYVRRALETLRRRKDTLLVEHRFDVGRHRRHNLCSLSSE